MGQLCACARVRLPVCVSGSVVSSDKSRAGSTSLQRKENPSSGGDCWKGGWRDGSGWWVKCWRIHVREGGQLWRSQSGFGQVSRPHLVKMQICDNSTDDSSYHPIQHNSIAKPQLHSKFVQVPLKITPL